MNCCRASPRVLRSVNLKCPCGQVTNMVDDPHCRDDVSFFSGKFTIRQNSEYRWDHCPCK